MSERGFWPALCNGLGRQVLSGVVLTSLFLLPAWHLSRAAEPVATYSIVGYDPSTGDIGVAVQSKFFAVGAVVPWARAEVGAVATQAFGNTTFGPRGLALLESGMSVEETLEELLAGDDDRERRQVGIVDAEGHSASFTGSECMDWAGHRTGPNYAAQGNILVSGATVDSLAETFEATNGTMLVERLMRCLEAAQAAGGDSRGVQSAAIIVERKGAGYGGFGDRYCDLRVDDHEEPIAELRRLVDLWKEQALIIEGYRLVELEAYDEAVRLGREAVALTPEKGAPYYHLACYYSRAGMREEALENLRTAVSKEPSLGPRATEDPDFEPLYDDPEFKAITVEP
ncbi:MAG: DUF1028 domain-containing protein [Candidatus Eisenbacteria bacterium]|nr:DUF1028 domain-containing protein [Candidatus Eisenbacteria bacterium]